MRHLALSSLAIWIAILPLTQPEQQLRRRVEVAFRDGRLVDALDMMSAHAAGDFPPHWEPPPRFLKGESPSLVFEVWEEIIRKEPAPWVRDRYVEQLKNRLRSNHRDDQQIAELLNQLPEAPALLQQLASDPFGQWRLERLDSHLRPELRVKMKTRSE